MFLGNPNVLIDDPVFGPIGGKVAFGGGPGGGFGLGVCPLKGALTESFLCVDGLDGIPGGGAKGGGGLSGVLSGWLIINDSLS